jgi:hypothetical protein
MYGQWSIAVRIFNLYAAWVWMVSFAPGEDFPVSIV